MLNNGNVVLQILTLFFPEICHPTVSATPPPRLVNVQNVLLCISSNLGETNQCWHKILRFVIKMFVFVNRVPYFRVVVLIIVFLLQKHDTSIVLFLRTTKQILRVLFYFYFNSYFKKTNVYKMYKRKISGWELTVIKSALKSF